MKRSISILLVLFAVLMLAAAPAAAQDSSMFDTITVTGTGSASGTPDIANLEIGVDVADANVATAFENANTTVEAIIAAVVEAGVAREDIRTTGLNIFQDYSAVPMMMPSAPNESGMAQEAGPVYRVNNQVRVIIRDINAVAAVINAAVGAGANNIYGLSFGIEDRAALETEARAAAMADAQARAAEYAGLIGAELGEVVVVVEGYGGGFSPFDTFNMARPAMDAGGAVIEPGQLSVNVQVQVTYTVQR